MSDYVKATNFAAKDSLITGNPAKIVKGTEIDTEFTNIATAIATKADTTYVDTQIAAAGTGSVSSVATGTGLTGGPITSTGTISLATSGVTAGTYGEAGVSYPIITVDSTGRIASATYSSISGGGSSGVSSFNSRTGAVTLGSSDVTNAIGYTPYNGTSNPSGFIGTSTFTGSNQSLGTNGYQKLPGGLILQWGSVAVSATTTNITFPVSFSSACYSVQLTSRADGDTDGLERTPALKAAPTTSGFSASTYGVTDALYWFAVGY